jgi:hypothetical protein
LADHGEKNCVRFDLSYEGGVNESTNEGDRYWCGLKNCRPSAAKAELRQALTAALEALRHPKPRCATQNCAQDQLSPQPLKPCPFETASNMPAVSQSDNLATEVEIAGKKQAFPSASSRSG